MIRRFMIKTGPANWQCSN